MTVGIASLLAFEIRPFPLLFFGVPRNIAQMIFISKNLFQKVHTRQNDCRALQYANLYPTCRNMERMSHWQ